MSTDLPGGGKYTDGLGFPRPVIHYDLSEYTRLAFCYAEIFARQVYLKLGATPYTQNPRQVPGAGGALVDNPVWFPNPAPQLFEQLPPQLLTPEISAGAPIPAGFQYFGSGHLVGTVSMGSSQASSVVDKNQRSWDHPNLFMVGSGVFPTVTTANPTLTLAALAFQAADAISKELGG